MTRVRIALAVSIVALSAALLGSIGGVAGAAEPLNAAGLVVQHEDGRVLYIYVRFAEDEITGADLLARSGLALEIAPYSGLGQGVCSIDHEGCPSTNCYCRSYGNPARYWRYFRLGPDGRWLSLPIGPSSRPIKNGDVDGWVWGVSEQPPAATSIEDIARINGALAETPGLATPDDQPTRAAPSVSATEPVSPISAQVDSTAVPEARAVQVDPSGQVSAVEPEAGTSSGPDMSYLAFAAIALATAGVAVWVVSARRRRRG